ncbi:phosphopyruvate hydratase, partial [Candidatus Woesearchaeota archaeon]|nr:phosphopyruvate hydratase [Candidatus Woesearchaeota archaeon]
MNPKIKRLWSKQIFDSRGNPTIETDVFSDCFFARSMVPSGASTGKHEALELRDGGKRFGGKGVLKAVNNVNKKIAPKLRGKDCRKQKEIDELMIKLDGTENKSKLGANSILSVSMAVCKASTMHK